MDCHPMENNLQILLGIKCHLYGRIVLYVLLSENTRAQSRELQKQKLDPNGVKTEILIPLGAQ